MWERLASFRRLVVGQFVDLPSRLQRRSWLLAAYFFLVIATYWILKPIKRGLIINYFGDRPFTLFSLTLDGAEAEQIAKVLNMVAAYLAAIGFTWLARRCPRHHLVLVFTGLSVLLFVVYAAVLDQPTEAVVWSFYVFGDMFNTVMVALFWAFTSDIGRPSDAKRTYGIIGLGGVLGGFVGATVVSSVVQDAGRASLLLVCIVPMVLVAVIAVVVHRMAATGGASAHAAAEETNGRSVATEGAHLVWRSRYLFAIAGVMACYEIVSNIIDFQLARTVERLIPAPLEKDAFFATVGQVIGLGSIAVQLLVTGIVMRRLGVRAALLVLPLAVLASSTGFLIAPTLVFAGAVSVSVNALNYSINQSAREALYTATSEDTLYKAKAFIDMFVQRSAKVLSVGLNLLLSVLLVDVRWLTVATALVVVVWIGFVVRVGLEFRARAHEPRVAGALTDPAPTG